MKYKEIITENLEILVNRIKRFENTVKRSAINRLGISHPTFYKIKEEGKATEATIAKIQEARDFYKKKSGDSTKFDIDIVLNKEYRRTIKEELDHINSIVEKVEERIKRQESKKK